MSDVTVKQLAGVLGISTEKTDGAIVQCRYPCKIGRRYHQQ